MIIYIDFQWAIRGAFHLARPVEVIKMSLLQKFNLLGWNVDMVVPVPSSKQTLKHRGYNQAELIGKKFADITKLNFENKVLQKVKHTEQQASLSGADRRKNLDGSFFIDKSFNSKLKGKTVLLVDDVITTCSTISVCAKELKKHGVKVVLVLGFARAFKPIPGQANLKNAKSFVK